MPGNMKKVYLHAAERITEFKCYGCCAAIEQSCDNSFDFFKTEMFCINHFAEVFKPKNRHIHEYWYGVLSKRNQLSRSLALLFMAEMCDEDS